MVAKSFQSFEMVGEPYESNGKMYINASSAMTLHNIRKQLKTFEQANSL